MKKRIVIFGAGLTGLSAGRELTRHGHQVDVYEAADHVGGLASTFRDDQGFIYDNGPRFIFSTLARKIGIEDICERVQYYEHLYVGGRYYLFPFGFSRNVRFCLSVGIAMLTRGFKRKPRNLGEFLRTYYGGYFSGKVLIPLITKWCGVPVDDMSIDFASRLLPTNIGYVIYSMIKKLRGGITEDYYKQGRYIVYPKGSNSMIFDKLLETPGMNVHLNAKLISLKSDGDTIVEATVGNEKITADYFLSTIPIKALHVSLDSHQDAEVWGAFQYRGILLLIIKIKRTKILESLWTWFPEERYRFYRISEFKNALKELAPKDKTLIAIELACNEDDPYWKSDAQKIYDDIKDDLNQLYGLKIYVSGFNTMNICM